MGELTLAGAEGIVSALYMERQRHRPIHDPTWIRDDDRLAGAATQLGEYFDGSRTDFDLEVRFINGTAFQQRVWRELLEIPYGETRTYADLAAAIGLPTATRAVGAANGRNPISIIVPCHRVLGSDGALTGYGGGIERKRALLELERAPSPVA